MQHSSAGLITLFPYRFDVTAEELYRDILLVYSQADTLAEDEFKEAVERDLDENLTPDEIMVVVRQPAFECTVSAFQNSAVLATIKKRVNSAIIVAAFGSDGRETYRQVVHGATKFEPLRLERLVRRTITHILTRHDGYEEAHGNYHFQIPSGRHTERFIRYASVLVDAAELSFVALGALPLISEHINLAYVDTSGLFEFVAAISDHLRAFVQTRPSITVKNFQSYDGYKECRFRVAPTTFVFISASGSGTLSREILKQARLSPQQIIHLLYFGRSEESFTTICNLSRHPELNPEGLDESKLPQDYRAIDCELCKKGSTFVPLRGDHFELPGPQPMPIEITIQDAPRSLGPLFARLGAQKVFHVGFGKTRDRTDPSTVPHRP
ncbi:MAG: hypothetical protein DLM68_17170 [Hyphomicrobiales bacterium]|nr:MAG: hypothetical protein DLM68_17170 [Hyphomicrobiales bacterium]